MGSKWIWIVVSSVFGMVCASIYAWMRRRDGHTLRRWIIWAILYAMGGLAICRLLWIVFAS